MNILTRPVAEDDYDLARGLIAARPVYKGSHRGEAANEVGCLGEAVVLRVLTDVYRVPVEPVFDTTHDLEFADGTTAEGGSERDDRSGAA